MTDRTTLVLFFPFDLLSHYLRCITLADTYDPSTHKVMFAGSSKYNHFVTRHGYEVFDAEAFDADYVMECTQNFNFDWLNKEAMERVLVSQVGIIRDLRPDLVIGDVSPTLRMAAEITGVYHINLVNGYMTRYYAATRKIPSKHPAAEFLNQLPAKVAEVLTSFGEKLAFRKLQIPFNLLRKKYGLTAVRDYLEEMEGRENLICDLPELFPQKMLPENYRFIGPLSYKYQAGNAGMDDDYPPVTKPVICVCMGSTGDWKGLSFLNDPYFSRYTIITAGDKDKYLNAAHIISKEFVNLNSLLQMSSLLICHGGNGTIYAGIQNQTYMLCLSSHFEQEYNIDALERMGYGKSALGFSIDKWRREISFYCEEFKIRQHA